MPDVGTVYLIHTAVLWPALAYDGYGERKVSDEPVELNVRWDDSPSESGGPQDRTITHSVKIVVDRQIGIGSRMWKGNLAQWRGTTDDAQQVGSTETVAERESRIMYVQSFTETWDLKGRFAYRTVTLQRSQDVEVV